MRLVINKPDGLVGVDGAFLAMDLSAINANIHAVQWFDNVGHVEKNDLSVVEITDISEFEYLVKLHHQMTRTENERLKKQDKEINAFKTFIEKIDSKFLNADKVMIDKIINIKWAGITLAEKIRVKDGALIGVNIDYLFGDNHKEGVNGLLAIRRLLKYAKSLSVPVFAELKPERIDKEQFSLYFEKLGATVTRNSMANYMVYES